MGLWVRKPELEAREHVRWSRFANRTQSKHRAVGGRLFLTEHRLLFEPNRFDALTGGGSFCIHLRDVVSVDVEPPGTGNVFSGGLLRPRLRLDFQHADPELFVVNGLDQVVDLLRKSTQAE